MGREYKKNTLFTLFRDSDEWLDNVLVQNVQLALFLVQNPDALFLPAQEIPTLSFLDRSEAV